MTDGIIKIEKEKKDKKKEIWKKNPILFFEEVLGVPSDKIWDKMRDFAELVAGERKVAVKAGHSVSKAVDVDTPILTAKGMKPIKDVHIGDTVFNEQGKPTKVIEESRIMLEDSYRVKFDDSAEIIAHAGHLWNIHDYTTRKAIRRTVKKYPDKDYRDNWDSTQTVNTKWIFDNLKHHKQNNVSIPITKPIGGREKLDIPYTVGFWLGDGTRGSGCITVGNQDSADIVKNITAEGFIVNKHSCNDYGYTVSGKRRMLDALRKKLRDLGILYDKHFPEWFIFLPLKTKIRVIQGYMDADGYKLGHGRCAALGTTDKRLYDSFLPFLASTGVKIFRRTYVMKYKGNDKLVYNLNFSPEYQPFALERKKIKTSKIHQMRKQARMVLSCEYIGKRYVKCISVDNVRKLFLCGRDLVPTHNTYTAARLVLWYLYCFQPSTVITTAPTNTQVEELLWREIREAHANALIPLGGHLTQTQLDLQPLAEKMGKSVRWFAMGFSTRPDQGLENATKMQGFHNEHMMVLFDEADGILTAIWNALDALMTNERVKFVAIGNPLRPSGEFTSCFSDSSYATMTISVLDTPNYKEDRDVIHGLSGRQYAEDMEKKWGKDSDIYKSRVLGEIPDSNPEAIIPVSWYERAEERVLPDSDTIKRFVVVDVADGGADDTVLKKFVNKTQTGEHRFPGKKAEEIYGDVARINKEHGGNAIIYDHDGCGRVLGGLLRGIIDTKKIDIIGFEGSAPAYVDADFLNRRAEGHYAMYCDFRDNLVSVPKNHAKMKEDIVSVKWGDPKRGKITVEPKKDLKKRLGGRSPDDGDDIMMMSACYDQVKPVEVIDMYKDKEQGWQPSDWLTA